MRSLKWLAFELVGVGYGLGQLVSLLSKGDLFGLFYLLVIGLFSFAACANSTYEAKPTQTEKLQ